MELSAQPHTQAAELDLSLAEADQALEPLVPPLDAARDEDPRERLDRQILAGLVAFKDVSVAARGR